MTLLEEPAATQSPRGPWRELVVVTAVITALVVVGVGVGLYERARGAGTPAPLSQAEQLVKSTCDQIWGVRLNLQGVPRDQQAGLLREASRAYAAAGAQLAPVADADLRWRQLREAIDDESTILDEYAALLDKGDDAAHEAEKADLEAQGWTVLPRIIDACTAVRSRG